MLYVSSVVRCVGVWVGVHAYGSDSAACNLAH